VVGLGFLLLRGRLRRRAAPEPDLDAAETERLKRLTRDAP
jgi:hypothetical protein